MRKRNPEKGNAVIETALMLPWLFFLFVGIIDFGFFTYAAICTQGAARVAAMEAAATSESATQSVACQAALGEMKTLPGASGLTGCATAASQLSDALPVYVGVPVVRDNATTPPCADCDGTTPTRKSVVVSVTYRTLPMIPIPGLMQGRWHFTRHAEMRLP